MKDDTRAFGVRAALLVLLGAALLLPERQSAPLERAEIYFLDGARAMVETGDYLVPLYRGEPFFDKPPLTYWLIAAAFELQGFTTRAARLVPAGAALATLLATLWLGKLLLEGRAALAAGLVLTTTLAFLSFGRLAMSDMLLALWSTLAVGLAVAAWRPGAPRPLLPALGLVLGLGFLTKGPVGLLLPGLGILLLAWRRWRARPTLKAADVALAAILFLLVGFGWFAGVYARLGWWPLEHFFLRENLGRFAGETYDSGRATWFYLGAYVAGGLPWSLLLPLALLVGLRRREVPGSDGARFLAGWLGLMAVPLSLSRGKIDYYLLPFYPAVSLLIGWCCTSVAWGRLERVWARATLVLLAAGLAGLALFPTRIPRPWLPPQETRSAVMLAAVAACAVLLALAFRPGPRRVLGAVAALTAALVLAVVTLFLPSFRRRQPNLAIARDVIRELRSRPDARLVLCADPARAQRDILFLARLAAEERCDLWDPASSRIPFLLLVRQEERESLERAPGVRIVGEYRYVPATALTFTGLWRRYDADLLVLMANYPTDDPAAIARQKQRKKRALRAQAAKDAAAAAEPDGH